MKLLKFYMDYCNPCRTLTTMIDGFSICPIEKVNINLDVDNTRRYNIRSVPTLILVNDTGQEVWRHSGLIDRIVLENQIKRVMK